ncbi:MAG: nuclear transport factor 2 family protein [Bacteroidetes bacterium HGW-Bacteroidetes-2]|nr:MAG: nuclear transport factor 2 family protein [Bacteroidetes bacterium HGW-Bacteroidetes-2]
MKKVILLGLTIVLFMACNQQYKRYTQNSPEIETYKKVIAAYENQNWQELVTYYADTAKIFNNATKKNAQTVAQLVAQNKQDAALFSSWKYVPEESEYEMVVTDKGETWVNFWGLWQARLIANDLLYEIPVHITARFMDGKIVKEHGYWDISKLVLDLQTFQEAAPPKTKTAETQE